MAGKDVTASIGNALGINETMVDILTLGSTAVFRATDKVVDDISGTTKKKEEAKKQEIAQAAAEKEAAQLQSDSEARKKAQLAMKSAEYEKRGSESGGGRSGTVLGSAGMNANSGMKFKTLLGE